MKNVVQANLVAAVTEEPSAVPEFFNVATDRRTMLIELLQLLRSRPAVHPPQIGGIEPFHRGSREGDVLHSRADISKARRLLGYGPTHGIVEGLDETLPWYKAGRAASRSCR